MYNGRICLWAALNVMFLLLDCTSGETPALTTGCSFGVFRRIVLEYGSPLEIFCSIVGRPEKATGRNSSAIRFYSSGTRLPQEYVQILNATTARMLVPSPEPSTGKYFCRLHQGEERQILLWAIDVVIGYKPRPVGNFSCLSWNWESLNCTWNVPDNPLRTRYKIMYGFIGRGQRWLHKCPKDTEDSGFCYWDTRTEPHFRPNHQYLIFTFTGSNELANVKFPRIKFSVWAHVLTDKPLYLRSEEITTNSALLQWDMKFNLKNFPPGFDRKIQYKSMCDPSDAWKTADTSQLPKMSTNYSLQGLRYPNVLYDVRLYLKSRLATREDTWSEPALYTFVTKPTIPPFPPDTISGSFQISRRLDRRDIIIYWQRIPKCSENGDDFSYKVTSVEQNGEVVTIRPSNIAKSYAKFDNLTMDSYTFRIVSANKEGVSEDSSTVHVASEETIPPAPTNVTRYVTDIGVIQLSWDQHSEEERAGLIDSYTLFMCVNDGYWPHHCSGYLSWTRVSKNVRTVNITVRDARLYEFGISSNTDTWSSGIIWAACK